MPAWKCMLVAAAAVLSSQCAALAGDLAGRYIIGFSADGGHFALEEYGIQDGSGFPYANIYVVDVERDAWVDGSPIRLTIKDEQASLEDVRGEARQQARFLIQQFDLTHEGNVVATNIYTHESADPYTVTFQPRLATARLDEPITLTLEQYKLDDKALCRDVAGDNSKGFELTMSQSGRARVLHQDTRIPGSRLCPLEYRIHDVVTFYPQGGEPVLAVIVQVLQVGFEGPDGRFLVVTARF